MTQLSQFVWSNFRGYRSQASLRPVHTNSGRAEDSVQYDIAHQWHIRYRGIPGATKTTRGIYPLALPHGTILTSFVSKLQGIILHALFYVSQQGKIIR